MTKQRMTDKELFKKLAREGECWQEELPNSTIEACPICHYGLLNETYVPPPEFDDWPGFGWLWDRAQERKLTVHITSGPILMIEIQGEVFWFDNNFNIPECFTTALKSFLLANPEERRKG